MSNFLVRIELHGASAVDYELLHEAMVACNFSRSVKGSDGKNYLLPTAEYVAFGNATTEHVRDLAIAAANTTGRSSWVLAVSYEAAAWQLNTL